MARILTRASTNLTLKEERIKKRSRDLALFERNKVMKVLYHKEFDAFSEKSSMNPGFPGESIEFECEEKIFRKYQEAFRKYSRMKTEMLKIMIPQNDEE